MSHRSERLQARVRAFAKLNLSLRILGTRPDGYHELRTIFQSVALHDTLSVLKVPGAMRLECDDPACPVDSTNLVWRAALALWKATSRAGQPRGIGLRLTKRIPMAAGLGGGSSDAAAALRVLGALWRVDAAAVQTVARSLGADVPYFLEGGTALGLDRGDLVFPLIDAPAAWVVLVIPPFGVSTNEAYAWWDNAFGHAAGRTRSARPAKHRGVGFGPRDGAKAESPVWADLGNDLQPAVVERHPEIGRIISALTRAGADHAAMSGSGSATFGLFSRRLTAERAARLVARGQRRVLVTRTLGHDAYQRLAGRGAVRTARAPRTSKPRAVR